MTTKTLLGLEVCGYFLGLEVFGSIDLEVDGLGFAFGVWVLFQHTGCTVALVFCTARNLAKMGRVMVISNTCF